MNEISMKELVAVIKKRKWILIVFTAACILASGVFSYITARPMYNAKVTFTAEPVEMKSGIDPGSIVIFNGDPRTLDTSNRLENKIIGAVVNKVKYPKYDINAMTNMINGQDFKDRVYNELKINKSITFNAVCNSDTKQITIITKGSEPEGLINTCKIIYDYFGKYIVSDAEKVLKSNDEMLSKGSDMERQNIEKYSKELKNFKAGIAGLSGIDINNMTLEERSDYQKILDNLNMDNLSEDKQAAYQEIMNNYVLANQAFDSYKLVKKELDIIRQSDISSQLNLQLLSQDNVPFKESPNIKVNLILGAVLGFMFCFIAVFFMEFWPKKAV
jgi:hypothetical protein